MTPQSSIPTEDDLRSRILIPYLQSLGIGVDQIRLEKRFRLKLGRTTVEMGSYRSRSEMGGRLDVLVRNTQGENLFVVELKSEKMKLTDDDVEQGISYARLLDQIAPFVLLSNGHESKIYDSITKNELSGTQIHTQSDFWRNGRVLATTEDIRIRYEALKFFVGYSFENVKNFSRAQQTQRLQSLRGSVLDAAKKYIPDIYIPRHQVRTAVETFISGDGLAFALVGQSGVGKTNEMCALAEKFGERHITLFLEAGTLYKGLTETLIDEFNWNFSDSVTAPYLMRRLDELATSAKCKVIILVDALDEADIQSFEKSVSDFSSHLSQFCGKIKLIVSVKTTEWDKFDTFRGNPSPLQLSLDTSWQRSDAEDNSKKREPKPFHIESLSHTELDEVVPKYTEFFKLGQSPEGELRNLSRSPFLLRIIGEVYAGQAKLPQDMSEEKLIDAWLRKKFVQMADGDQARRDLISFARALYKQSCTPHKRPMTLSEAEQVSESNICNDAGSSFTLSHELVSQGIVVRHEVSMAIRIRPISAIKISPLCIYG